MTNLNKAENKLPTDLTALTAEIKFYVKAWGQNTIEISKRLIAAKKLSRTANGKIGWRKILI